MKFGFQASAATSRYPPFVLEPKTLIAGRYEIVRIIGAGGMGAVYEATHLVSRRTIALKILAPEASRTDANRERFLREASAPAQIDHPGIVEVFDAGFDTQTGALFVAMELLVGETLRERLDRLAATKSADAREDALRLFGAVLEPLAAAHNKNIVHRDIKPENIFVQRGAGGVQKVKVLDFGIARDLDSDRPSVTRTGIAMGTPHYMAPEQAMNARDASFPADVWALGVILYEILSSTVPFPGETAGSIIAAAVTEAHRSLIVLAPSTPRSLSELTDRCLAKRPADRPANAGALLEAFQAARRPPLAEPHMPAPITQPLGFIGNTETHEAPIPVPREPVSTPAQALPMLQPVPHSTPVAHTSQSALESSSTTSKVILVGALAALLFAVLSCAVVGGIVAIFYGTSSSDAEPQAGVLEPGDRQLEGHFYDEYTVQIAEGESVDLYMRSSDFDAYLVVLGPARYYGENDDDEQGAEGERNAHLVIQNATAGAYTVRTTTFVAGARGRYALSIRR